MSGLRWRSDLIKLVITSNFEARGWQAARNEDEWDIWWASVSSVQQLFAPSSLVKLRPGHLVNHYPNHYELTHKDLLVKNVNRYRRRMRKAGHSIPHIIPPTFVLPQEYALFVEEFKKQPGSSTFILKPSSKAQGKGIFLINKLSQVKQEIAAAAAVMGANTAAATRPSVPSVFVPSGNHGSSRPTPTDHMRPALEDYVVSRYIHNPLLVLGGNKFDLRLYVLVPSFNPLVVYLSSLGFARFTNVRYSSEVAQLDNHFVHLTNVAVQKEGGSAYNTSHGNKWPLQDLRLYLEASRGLEATAQLFADIQALVVHTLKAVQPVMVNDTHCFELHGFDVLIDDSLHPWLIEVNASPSMTSTTSADRLLKWQVVHDTLSIVAPPAAAHTTHTASTTQHTGVPAASSSGNNSSSHAGGSLARSPSKKGAAAGRQQQRQYDAAVGCMQLIHHEGLDTARRPGKHSKLLAASGANSAAGSPTSAVRKRILLHG